MTQRAQEAATGSEPSPGREVSVRGARALLGERQGPAATCPVCTGPLIGRGRVCSGRCRAELSRRRRAEKARARGAEIMAHLTAALRLLESAT